MHKVVHVHHQLLRLINPAQNSLLLLILLGGAEVGKLVLYLALLDGQALEEVDVWVWKVFRGRNCSWAPSLDHQNQPPPLKYIT